MTMPARPLHYGSVCSGIEAVTLAWQPLGLIPAWFAEIDPFASAVLTHHYPHVRNLGDMTCIAPKIRSGAVSAPDILVGGTPCQSFSIAGLRQGLADPRGTLTLNYVEIANAIDQARTTQHPPQPPAILVWENVPGVLSDRANAFGCLVGALAGEDRALQPPGERWTHAGCVYGPQRAVAWRVLDAQYFGLAQRRQRVFVVGSARHDFDPAAVLFERACLSGHPAPRRGARKDVAGAIVGSTHKRLPKGECDQLIAYGGNDTSGPIEIATACNTRGGNRLDFESDTFIAGALQHSGKAAGSATQQDAESGMLVPLCFDETQITSPENRCNPQLGDPSHPLAARARPPTIAFNARQDPDSWNEASGPLDTDGTTQAIAFSCKDHGADASKEVAPTLRAMNEMDGNANAGGQIAVAEPYTLAVRGRGETHDLEYRRDGVANALLTPNGGRAGMGVGAIATRYAVRRLTPIECERLQGLPDSYTLVSYRGNPACDGPRYKAIGNSMAVPCVRWIGERLMSVLGQATVPERRPRGRRHK